MLWFAYVDTGIIAANHTNLFAAELAGPYGSFYAQSEAIYAEADRIGGPNLGFGGAYAYSGYFLTGEQ